MEFYQIQNHQKEQKSTWEWLTWLGRYNKKVYNWNKIGNNITKLQKFQESIKPREINKNNYNMWFGKSYKKFYILKCSIYRTI